MASKKLIGITLPDKGNVFARFFIKFNLFLQGAKGISLRPSQKNIEFNKLDGIIISGGNDIDPLLYGGNPEAHNTPLDKNRDAFELEIIDKAYKKRLPILGICRGTQLINIYFNGDIYPTILDLDEYIIHKNSIFPIKAVFIKRGSKLFTILKKDTVIANSIHNQTIKTVGDTLNVSAKHEKIIEAIEKKDYPFLIGVQWHPEYLFYLKNHRNIFKNFILSCKTNTT